MHPCVFPGVAGIGVTSDWRFGGETPPVADLRMAMRSQSRPQSLRLDACGTALQPGRGEQFTLPPWMTAWIQNARNGVTRFRREGGGRICRRGACMHHSRGVQLVGSFGQFTGVADRRHACAYMRARCLQTAFRGDQQTRPERRQMKFVRRPSSRPPQTANRGSTLPKHNNCRSPQQAAVPQCRSRPER